MQKLIPFIVIIIFIVSCNEGVPIQPLDDPMQYTTQEIQEARKDTVIVSVDEDNIYIFDDHNVVRYKITNMYNPGDRMVLIPLHLFLLFILLITLFMIFVFNKIR